MVRRLFNACMLGPAQLKASDDRLEVAGVFNPGAAEFNGKVVLLVRVAENVREKREGYTALPRWQSRSGLVIDWINNDLLEFLDPRVVRLRREGVVRLTFLSHLRVFESADGRSIDREMPATFRPETEMESYGVEDPRITRLDDRYYFTYVAVSRHGACTALASTRDFKQFDRHGVIFCSENKDVLLFPELIGGQYVAFHRPNPATLFNPPEMWLANSADLIHWGQHRPFHTGGAEWELGRIGGGCPPIRTDDGWLEIYHGNDKTASTKGVGRYVAGLLLLDINHPDRLLKRSVVPVMAPETDFETAGFVPNVVFPTGIVQRDDLLQVYYGAADACTGVVEMSLRELLSELA